MGKLNPVGAAEVCDGAGNLQHSVIGYNPRPKPEALSEQLVWYRTGKGWTQRDFAKALGVDPTTLATRERGERAPLGKYRALVASVLGQSM